MLVDRHDGQCRSCGGLLEIEDVEDCLMHVRCTECEDCYDVETDAFGDGCMTYFLPLMTEKLLGPEEGDA